MFAQTRARGSFVGGNGFRRVALKAITETLKWFFKYRRGNTVSFPAPSVRKCQFSIPDAGNYRPAMKPPQLPQFRSGVRKLIAIGVRDNIAPFTFPRRTEDQFSI